MINPPKHLRVPIHVVFYQEAQRWLAHCLEFDLIGDGDSRSDALVNLTEAIEIQVAFSIENNNLSNLFAPADGKYFEMYAAGDDVSSDTPEWSAMIGSFKGANSMVTDVTIREYHYLATV